MMKTIAIRKLSTLASIFCLALSASAQHRVRTELAIPDIPGYLTLKCDFHMHTVFSDGLVWPTVRVEEAWRQGLDAIAITDHVEYHPYRTDVSTNLVRSYEIARATADSLGIILIPSAEITRAEPPGHLNALFLTNQNRLVTTDYREEVKIAAQQGAFLFWCHPGWKQPNGRSVWYPEQGEFHAAGFLHGLEIVNGNDYDPIVHQWCQDKNLTLVGNSDAHDPLDMVYERAQGELRPMTLVFASARHPSSIREALLARRTAVYSQNTVYGDTQFLSPLFSRSVDVKNPAVTIKGKGRIYLQVRNHSVLDFELKPAEKVEGIALPAKFLLPAGKTALLSLQGTTTTLSGSQRLQLPFFVDNLKVAPNQPLRVVFEVLVTFIPVETK